MLTKLTFDELAKLKDDAIVRDGYSVPLLIIIHPDREKDFINLLEAHCRCPGILGVSEIMGMTIIKDEACPIDKISVLPESEYKRFTNAN